MTDESYTDHLEKRIKFLEDALSDATERVRNLVDAFEDLMDLVGDD